MNTYYSINQKYSLDKILEHTIYLSLFLIISNYLYPFYYGVSDNREEVPALFFINGLGIYTNDEFIRSSVSDFNVATPYLYGLSFLTKALDFSSYPVWLFSFLQITLVGIFLTCKSIFQSFSPKLNYFHYFLSFTILQLLLFKFPYFIFGGRWFISNYFDPQFLAYALCFVSIYFFITEKYKSSALFLFFGNLLSPLLVNPIFLSFFIVILVRYFLKHFNLFKLGLINLTFLISVLPYTLFLYLKTSSYNLIYDAQKIMTQVRAPDLSRIPNLNNINFYDLYFFGFTCILIFLVLIVFYNQCRITKKNIWCAIREEFNLNFILFTFFLLVFLIVSFIVSSVYTLPLLYRLDPFRVSVLLVPLIYLFLASYFLRSNIFQFDVLRSYKFVKPVLLILIIFFVTQNHSYITSYITSKADGDEYNYDSGKKFTDAKEVMFWIKSNTKKTDTFINYADSRNFVTLRTHALRSTFFSWKTINLTNLGIVNWYKRLLIHYNVLVDPNNYKDVLKFVGKKGRNINSVNISQVLSRISYDIDYILIPANFELLDNNFPIIFENKSYFLFKTR